MEFNYLWLLAAIGGGIFGAAIGALPNFILCGFAAIIGAAVALASGNAEFANLVAWGPILGPQIGFAGGAAAAVYAYKKGALANGRDIATALMGLDRWDVLAVGGIFGALGYILWWFFAQFNIGALGATNPIALSIVVNAIIARVVFGKTGVFGKVRAGDNRWLPSDVASWLPWQSKPTQLLTLGLGLGIAVSWTTVAEPKLAAVWFGVSAAALVFLQFGVKVPVTHHIALAAEQVIVVAGGDIWWGLAFAVAAAFIGEFWACTFTAHGDSHIDPPSASLATTFTLMAILNALGAFQLSGMASFAIAVIVALVGFAVMSMLKSHPNHPVVASPAGI